MADKEFVDQVKKHLISSKAVIISNPCKIDSILHGKSTGDIDVIIEHKHVAILKRNLLKAGFFIEVKRYSMHKALFFIFDPEYSNLIMVDVYWRYIMRIDGNIYELNHKIINTCIRSAHNHDDGLMILDSKYRMLFILIGILCKGNKHEKYKDELVGLEKLYTEFSKLLSSYGVNESEREIIIDLMKNGTENSTSCLNKIQATLFIRLHKVIQYPLWTITLATWIPGIILKRPPIVSIIGLDGTGKTTLNHNLLSRIPIKIRIFYWGSRSMLLPTTRLHRWLERKIYNRDVRATDNPEVKFLPANEKPNTQKPPAPKSIIKSIVLLLMTLNKYAEYMAKYTQLSVHRLCGSIVITDRYVYDEYLEYNDRFYRFNRFLYHNLYFKPSILVITTAPAALVHKRKPSIPVKTAQFHIEEYQKIGKQYSQAGVQSLEVSSDNPIDQNVNKILRVIFNMWDCALLEVNVKCQ